MDTNAISNTVTMWRQREQAIYEQAQPTISVVVPVYNSEHTLLTLCRQLAEVLPRLSEEHEIILVNDGSRDQSWSVVCQIANADPRVHGINLMRNYGQHNALLCGIRAARHDIIVTIDDDLQHPPEEIAKVLDKLGEGFDVVYGVPEHEQHGFLRDIASQFTKIALQSAMGARVARNVSAFRAFRMPLRTAFSNYRSPYVSIDVLLTWASTSFSAVHVRHEPRTIGKSNYTFRKLITHAFNMITGYSTLPLQFASIVGLSFALFGLVVLAFVIGRYFVDGSSVAGFPFLASVIAIFSGAQLFALGVIGEYLARMYFRTMDRPTYSVRADTLAEHETYVVETP